MAKRHERTNRARSLRRTETKSEKLLWSLLRAKQICGLKFRRQHPVGPFFADFACVSTKLVVEIDGGYHDEMGESDLSRQAYLEEHGWSVIRFTDRDVIDDPESVAIAIARHLGLSFDYLQRKGTGSGMENIDAPNRRVEEPSPAATASDPPASGRVS